MTQTLNWAQIEARLEEVDLVAAMEAAFAAYARGEAVIPPVGEMVFEDPPGDVHIKYGYRKGGSHYVVKIASGFYDNPKLGLSSCQGLMLLFDQRTGAPYSILLDEGRLTDARTGAAGALAAKKLAPAKVECIGVLGSGTQARVQARYLKEVTDCRQLRLWGRRAEGAAECAEDLRELGFEVEVGPEPEAVVTTSQLIVTTTPSTRAIEWGAWRLASLGRYQALPIRWCPTSRAVRWRPRPSRRGLSSTTNLPLPRRWGRPVPPRRPAASCRSGGAGSACWLS